MVMKPKMDFMGMTLGFVFGSYFLNTIAIAKDTLSWKGYVSPFHYLDFSVSDLNYSINFSIVGIMLFVSIVLLIVSYKIYKRKDISA
jgi:hypothetical protein